MVFDIFISNYNTQKNEDIKFTLKNKIHFIFYLGNIELFNESNYEHININFIKINLIVILIETKNMKINLKNIKND